MNGAVLRDVCPPSGGGIRRASGSRQIYAEPDSGTRSMAEEQHRASRSELECLNKDTSLSF